ncbi:MAG TPA: DUF72 domain-containing protein [Candidatus Dormibacteraeota bacterium]|nr:DUF72 domain-containing protein [Candidatus Dormibacteraeota bacterium]
MVVLHVGTSGWQYRDWRGTFYPKGVAQRDWLRHYARRFATVELNNSFYRLPERSSFERWRDETPDDFVVAAKMSRFLTHLKRLRDPEDPVELFLERARGLGPKLGPVLLQLPPQMRADPERLAAALDVFPTGVRVAVEPRHDSWFDDRTRAVLEAHGAALCLADSPRRRTPSWRTADWGFVRFHEGRATPHPCYGERALATWAERIASLWPASADVFCFFNNDGRACAVRDAMVFGRLARRAGLRPTRVPEPDEVRLAS